jgi:hypothetical protein
MDTATESYSTNTQFTAHTFAGIPGAMIKRFYDDKPRVEILFGGEIRHVMYAPGLEYRCAVKALEERNEEWFLDTLDTISAIS